MKFNSNYNIKQFAKNLIEVLSNMNENELKNELEEWDRDVFTTPSEFLGELRIILEKIIRIPKLDFRLKKEISSCILAINKAFSKANE